MNLTLLVLIDAVAIVVMFLSLSMCTADKHRHRKRNRVSHVHPVNDNYIDSKVTTLTPATNSTVDPKRIQNGYKMWTIDTYPNPQKQPQKCGRSGQPSLLCDPDGILSPIEADELDRVLNEACAETKCACQSSDSPWFQHDADQCHGYKVAVAIIYQLPPSEADDQENVSNEGLRWATGLRETKWKYGLCGDDVIILLVAGSSKVYTTVGNKAQELVTSECIIKAHAEVSTFLQDNRYIDTIVQIVKLYKFVLISGRSDVCKLHSDIQLHPVAIAVIALFSAFTIIAIVSAICCVCGACKHNIGDAKRTPRAHRAASQQESGTQHEYESGYGVHTRDYAEQCERPVNIISSNGADDSSDQYDESYPLRKGPRHIAHTVSDWNTSLNPENRDNLSDSRIPIQRNDGTSPCQRHDYIEVNS